MSNKAMEISTTTIVILVVVVLVLFMIFLIGLSGGGTDLLSSISQVLGNMSRI